jgi:hypothetical protein
MTILAMTIIIFYHQMVMDKWSKLTDISTISINFNIISAHEKIRNCSIEFGQKGTIPTTLN